MTDFENDNEFAIIQGLDSIIKFAIGKGWSQEKFLNEVKYCWQDEMFEQEANKRTEKMFERESV